jgi:hypothetical protein
MGQPFYKAIHTSVLRQVRAEPKKALALLALGTTVMVMWTRLFLFGAAAPTLAAGVEPQNPELPAPGAYTGQADSPALRALSEWVQGPIAPVTQNVFALKIEYFPQDGSKPVATPENHGETFWDQLAKSMAARADQEKARRILVENLQSQAAKLELQSTVVRDGVPTALIDGTLVNEGDSVKGFRIVRIETKRVIVEREGVRLELGFGY